jgi:hypothetical protein
MSVVIITYDAKCKHCQHFEYKNIPKKDGTRSKINRAFCKNKKSLRFDEQLTLKTKACDKIKL